MFVIFMSLTSKPVLQNEWQLKTEEY